VGYFTESFKRQNQVDKMNDEAIIAFLEEIVQCVDQKKINRNQRYLLGELYLKFNFLSHIVPDQEITPVEESMLRTLDTERRFINFMLVGWYLFILSELTYSSEQN
jgi:hypothetical protein